MTFWPEATGQGWGAPGKPRILIRYAKFPILTIMCMLRKQRPEAVWCGTWIAVIGLP